MADIRKIERAIRKMPKGTIVRMGGMSDCFQPLERKCRVALKTIKLLNTHGIGYLILTKSSLIADREYMATMDKNLAHIQLTITCLDDACSAVYEKASPPSERIKAIYTLQDAGFDVALRISPLIEEYIDFTKLNALTINKTMVEFLRVNFSIKKWLPDVDYSKHTLRQSNYWHLPLDEKLRLLEMVTLPDVSICEDVSSHYDHWQTHYNPNRLDCCHLRAQPTVATGSVIGGADIRKVA